MTRKSSLDYGRPASSDQFHFAIAGDGKKIGLRREGQRVDRPARRGFQRNLRRYEFERFGWPTWPSRTGINPGFDERNLIKAEFLPLGPWRHDLAFAVFLPRAFNGLYEHALGAFPGNDVGAALTTLHQQIITFENQLALGVL